MPTSISHSTSSDIPTRLAVFTVAVLLTVYARAASPAQLPDAPTSATPVATLSIDHLPVGAMLSWRCGDEEVAGFNVERSSDGFAFEIISRVTAGLDGGATYNYLDTERPMARTYYRITSFDRSGTSAHSPLAEAPATQPAAWYLNGGYSVEPDTEFAFEIEAAGVELLACELLDLTGGAILQRELLVQPGPNRLTVSTEDLIAGAYTLKISGSEVTETLHFLKTTNAAPDFQPMVRGN